MDRKTHKEKDCISCGRCKQNCEFLTKYNIDFSNIDALNQLAYHCMLCGKCTEVCPLGIDGRERILNIRNRQVEEQNGKLKGYQFLRFEKNNYKYKNYKKANKKSVLFMGCNYPSLFPKTAKKLIDLLAEYDIGVVSDCCGKPIAELGLAKETHSIMTNLNCNFQKHDMEEIIVVCPNCYYFLKNKIKIPIITIYEKLQQLGIINISDFITNDSQIYIPCPDRQERIFLHDIEQITKTSISEVTGIQCCGLGGVAAAKEPQFTKILAEKLNKTNKTTYVYCASCAGSFHRNSVRNVTHILNVMIGSDEQPDIKHSALNRMKLKISI